MSQLSDQLTAVNTQLTAVQADVRVLLELPREDPAAQAAADRLTTFVQAWDAEVPDADGSEDPTEPIDPESADRG